MTLKEFIQLLYIAGVEDDMEIDAIDIANPKRETIEIKRGHDNYFSVIEK